MRGRTRGVVDVRDPAAAEWIDHGDVAASIAWTDSD